MNGRGVKYYGVGVCDKGVYLPTVDGKNTKEYKLWRGMLRRCYDATFHKKSSSYISCEVTDSWRKFQAFAKWFSNYGYFYEDYQLDKDLLFRGNKIYGEQTCVFLPKEINLALISQRSSRGTLPIGVSMNKGRKPYRSTIKIEGGSRTLGTFETPEKAFEVYRVVKQNHLKHLAEEFENVIDPRAFKALMTYEISLQD